MSKTDRVQLSRSSRSGCGGGGWGAYQAVVLFRVKAGPTMRHDRWPGGLSEGLTFMLRPQ